MRALALLTAVVWLIGLAGPAFAAGGGGGHGGSAQKRTTTSPYFIEFQGLATAVVDQARPAGMLQVEFGLEVPDEALHERATRLMPLLRAECAEALRTYAGDMYVFGTPPDAEEIGGLMQQRVDGALGASGAQVVLAMVIYHSPR
jgi:flagellar basal body-associated protein FliL